MGLLSEIVRSWMERKYGARRRDVVYAHMLDDTVWAALEERPVEPPSGAMVVGELVHAGVERILGEPGERCRVVDVSDVEQRIVAPARRRWVRGGAVTVCGTADAVLAGRPVELKTTRRPPERWPGRWRRRACLYAWLYGAEEALLIVLDVVSGVDHVERVGACDGERLVREWLMGRYPYRTVDGLDA